ncbi:Ig-like domain-containing protein [Deinococcus arenicola]|uniref:Ig-like domain-containing protein n=1 Tax=Deinococcus arenicola TaxID=2994950 RepID=A0ABU4DSF1_9DEIO|nr:Ig-like domain-containing protein [Deinococcus sp. ZS9-10]MDV6375360.1 Ig-like domain-containing protein [Deinococcus sp. ZS9-10]
MSQSISAARIPLRLPLYALALTGLLAACNPTPPTSATVTGVTVNPTAATLKINEQKTFVATVKGTGSFDSGVTWTSSKPNVATVAATGVVTAISDGQTSIVATSRTDAKQAATAAVTVTGTTPVTSINAMINFQPASSATPAGFVADTGAAYNDALGYGWVRQDSLNAATHTPLDVGVNARDRALPGLEAQLNTFIHMQYNANSSGPSERTPAAWEYKVPNGTYTVTVSTGDGATSLDSQHALNIEGQKAILPYLPADTNKFRSVALRVDVSDGRLTIDATGGTNTKINYVTIASGNRPSVRDAKPTDGQTNVDTTGAVVADLNFAAGAVDETTLTQGASLTGPDGQPVPAIVNTSGGGDVVVLKPTAPLKPFTAYTFTITPALKDAAGNPFLPFHTSFVTGSEMAVGGPVAFDQIAQPNVPSYAYTSVEIGPDNMLYAATLSGEILRFGMGTDGTLTAPQIIKSVITAENGPRTIIGLKFDPSSTADNLVLWISNNVVYTGVAAPEWSGKITRLSGKNLETVQDYVVGLPRSVRDHMTNSISFKPGEGSALYVTQGSDTSTGAPDTQWGMRPEKLLTGALLRVDLSRITPGSPVNVKTGDGGTYNPYAPGAPVTLYATGIRNAFDMVWHSNGSLYVPANGGAAGGSTPSVPAVLPASCANRPDGSYKGPVVNGKVGMLKQKDFLFQVKPNKYYGHPNPERCEWVLNGGNPTPGADNDPAEVIDYPAGTQPDPNWGGVAYDFGESASPNGVIEEYSMPGKNVLLKNRLLVVRYSRGKDIIVLKPGPDGSIIASATLDNVPGLTNFNPSPLDLIENRTNGNIYVALLDETTGQGTIKLVRPK